MEKALRSAHHLISAIVAQRPRGFWLGFTVGIIWFGYVFSWLWSAYPLSYLGITSPIVALAILFGIFTASVLVNAVVWGTGAHLITRANEKIDPIYLPIFAAALFTLAEYARAWLYGIVFLGQGSVLGAHWTLGNIAYFMHPLGFITGTAPVWGIYGIDFGIAFFTTTIVMLVQSRMSFARFRLPLAIGVALFLCAYAIGSTRQSSVSPVPVSILQTQKPTYLAPSEDIVLDDFAQKAKLLDTVMGTPELKDGFIIFPEGSDFSTTLGMFLDPESLQKYFQALAESNTRLIENIKATEPGEESPRSRAIVIDGKEGVIDSYDKRILTPVGEFMPYVIRAIAAPFKDFLTAFSSARGQNHGEKHSTVTIDGQTFTILICSDLASPGTARTTGSEFIIAMNSLGVFEGNPLLESQMLAMARMRAREQGKYLVLASNSGHSFIINARGTVEKKTTETGYKILTGSIVPNRVSTWYNQLGDWPILFLSLAILWYFRRSIIS